MAMLGNPYLNLIDALKATDMATAAPMEVLATLCPFMRDANVMTANKGSTHLTNMRTGLPAVTWGALYQGIPQSKSTYSSVEDTTGFLEGSDGVDTRQMDLYPGETAKLRAMNEVGFMQTFAQTIDAAIWYSNANVSPKQFHGMSARYNTIANPNVIDGGGTASNNASIWFVTHGDMQTSVISPKNVPAGFQKEDHGKQRVLDANSFAYYTMETVYRQFMGITIGDWRYNARIANLDVAAVSAGTTKLNKLMSQAYYQLQGRRAYKIEDMGAPNAGRTAIYMNRQMITALDAASTNSTGTDNFIRLTPMEIQGEEVQTWRGMPIRETDALLNTETRVV